MQETWRERCAKFIKKIIDDNPGKTDTELRKLISAAYPGGRRTGHVYKMYLAATKDALKKETPKAKESVRNMWIK